MSEIMWPAIEGFVNEPSINYVDVHGILARCEERVAASLAAGSKPRNILLNSKHGLGKTLLAASLAKNLRHRLKQIVPMVVFDCSEDTREYHLKGTYNLNDGGSTSFVPGPIPTAIHLANTTGLAILCLEEMSALTPGAQKVLNSITDWRSGIFLPLLGRTIHLEPKANVLVLATMNPTCTAGSTSSTRICVLVLWKR
jgi:MoxR-like ATPase